jgi:TolB-like protein/tetratricopeptide (TPR) repeat protein
MTKPVKHLYQFGDFCLDATERLLYRRGGGVVPLKPKVVETLELLVLGRGRLLGKDELMERLWPDAFVEESNLAQYVYLLRKVLGAGEDGRGYIETVPRRGYRFTAEVEEVGEGLENEEEEAAPFDSLAVLPLADEGDYPDAEYLSEGITDGLIDRLSRLPRLRVMAHSSVFHYKGREVAPQEVGRELGVSTVLTGRVRRSGGRLFVRAELVDAGGGWRLWGGRYESPSADIMGLQETMARELSERLRPGLTGEERRRLARRDTESTEAYHLFIKARYYLNKRLLASIKRAVEYFRQAIELDPEYAPAYAGLADCYPLLNLYGALQPREAYTAAEAAATRALEIDDSFAQAHNSLGVIRLFYGWDRAGAEVCFRRAVELDPFYPDARLRYGMLLTAAGRFEEAEREMSRAQGLDPLSLIAKTIGAYPAYYSRDFVRAAERLREVTEMDSNYSMAHFRLGLTYAQQGRYGEALTELRRSAALSGDRDVVAALGYVSGLAGREQEARAALTELDRREREGFVPAYDRALVHLGMGDDEAALDWLERAYRERSYWLIYLEVDPALDPLRAHTRFAQLLRGVVGPA